MQHLIKDHVIQKVDNRVLHPMMRDKHYLKTLPRGCSDCYAIYNNGTLVGGAMFGYPVGANVKRGSIELKRFYLEPGCEKNTASWFLSRCVREFRGKTNRIITYADPKEGHTGSMYRAANFKYIGMQLQGTPYYQVGKRKLRYRDVAVQDDDTIVGILSGAIPLKRMMPKHKFEYDLT
jgi:hypothetical protein